MDAIVIYDDGIVLWGKREWLCSRQIPQLP